MTVLWRIQSFGMPRSVVWCSDTDVLQRLRQPFSSISYLFHFSHTSAKCNYDRLWRHTNLHSHSITITMHFMSALVNRYSIESCLRSLVPSNPWSRQFWQSMWSGMMVEEGSGCTCVQEYIHIWKFGSCMCKWWIVFGLVCGLFFPKRKCIVSESYNTSRIQLTVLT